MGKKTRKKRLKAKSKSIFCYGLGKSSTDVRKEDVQRILATWELRRSFGTIGSNDGPSFSEGAGAVGVAIPRLSSQTTELHTTVLPHRFECSYEELFRTIEMNKLLWGADIC